MSRVPSYDPEAVETKWQERRVREHTHEPDLDPPRRPFYNLVMFPYPAAEGLHVGNMFAFTGADIYGRSQRLQGHDVFEPIGFDAFGIHSENYALSVGINPAQLIPKNIETFRRQLRRFGGMFDWRHELSTTDPRYYKWTQWIFLQLFAAGLAFRKKAAVNWCPKDMSVIANEQVINGYCERHPDTKVEQRFLEQWFFNITKYAEPLLENLDRLDWSDSTRTLQRNWIGRSEGAELIFETPAGAKIPVFTTRPTTRGTSSSRPNSSCPSARWCAPVSRFRASRRTACSSTPANSAGCRAATRSGVSWPGSRSGDSRRPRCSTGCTTGAFHASATGDHPSRSSIATPAARWPCRSGTSRWSCRSSRTSVPMRAGSRRSRATRSGTS